MGPKNKQGPPIKGCYLAEENVYPKTGGTTMNNVIMTINDDDYDIKVGEGENPPTEEQE